MWTCIGRAEWILVRANKMQEAKSFKYLGSLTHVDGSRAEVVNRIFITEKDSFRKFMSFSNVHT